MGSLKVAIAGGGTGGHVYPGIAVADEIRARGGEAYFFGTARGLEKKLVPVAGFELIELKAASIDRVRPWRWPGACLVTAAGFMEARRVLARRRPDVFFGTGGFVSFSAAAAARSLGIPVVINEQNAVAGLANRILARFAKLCISAWSEAGDASWPCPVAHVGLPVRAAFFSMTRDKARANLGYETGDRVLLVFGGSRGSRSINDAVRKSIGEFLSRGIKVIWGTGAEHFEALRSAIEPDPNVKLLRYIDDMPSALHAVDVAVTRAGAMTVAELSACGTPAVLVPFPHATGDHQTANAMKLVKAGAAELVADAEAGEKLAKRALKLFDQPALRDRISTNVRNFTDADAAAKIADMIAATARGGAETKER